MKIPRRSWRTLSLWLLAAVVLLGVVAHTTGRGIFTALAVCTGVLVLSTFRRSLKRER